jgi:hypothetical protein
MKLPRTFAAALAFMLVMGFQDNLRAQVVEERESEGNPVVTVFRGTLYGAGTGLLLGGAYALIESDGAEETRDILRWGVAGGAIAGATVGLLYVLLRPQPEGDADVVSPDVTGALYVSNSGVDFGAPTLLTSRREDIAGRPTSRIEARLLQARF